MRISPFIRRVLTALHLKPAPKAKCAPVDSYSELVKLSDQKVNLSKLKPEDLLNRRYRPQYYPQRANAGTFVKREGGSTMVKVPVLTLKQRRIYK